MEMPENLARHSGAVRWRWTRNLERQTARSRVGADAHPGM